MKRVEVDTTVTLEEVETGERKRYTLVTAPRADVEHGRISVASPLGRAVLRHLEGDEVTVKLPKGQQSYEIVEVVEAEV